MYLHIGIETLHSQCKVVIPNIGKATFKGNKFCIKLFFREVRDLNDLLTPLPSAGLRGGGVLVGEERENYSHA